DLFLVRLRNGEPVGHRSHFLRASEGEVICGMGVRPDGMALLARPAPETSLERTSQSCLLATLEGTGKLEVWRDRLYGALAGAAGFMSLHEDVSDALQLAQERYELREQELLIAKA